MKKSFMRNKIINGKMGTIDPLNMCSRPIIIHTLEPKVRIFGLYKILYRIFLG